MLATPATWNTTSMSRHAAITAGRLRRSARTISTPSRIELRIASAADRPNMIAPGNQLFGDVQPQEAAGAGDQCVHEGLFP